MFNKTFFKFLGAGLVMVVLGIAALYAPSYWQKYRVDKAIAELERPYREDIYGGKTPEETFDMFLAALKKGDIDLASRYFAVRKRGEYKEKFEKMRQDGTLAEQIQEWERARKEWTKVVDGYNDWKTHATTQYRYRREEAVKVFDKLSKKEEVLLPGEYTAEIIFDLNELTNIWKITLL